MGSYMDLTQGDPVSDFCDWLPIADPGICLPGLHDDAGRWPLKILREILDIPETYGTTGYNSRNLFLDFIAVLEDSPLTYTMLEEAAEEGWAIALEDLGGNDLYIDIPEKVILLDNHGMKHPALGRSPFFKNTMILSFVRALRDVWQEKRYGAFTEYAPESILLLERVRAADNQVVTTMACWELKNAGHDILWRHMLGLPEGNLAQIYSYILEKERFSNINHTAYAATVTFHAWFEAEERVTACDHAVLEALDDMMESAWGRPFGNLKALPVCVERLSRLPDRTAYLQGQGQDIITHPLYHGLTDLINQSHFLQIIKDSAVTYVQNVPFRDAELAQRIFPEETPA